MNIFDKFFTKFAYKFDKGYPDMNNDQDVLLLESLISEAIGENFSLQEKALNFNDIVGESRKLIRMTVIADKIREKTPFTLQDGEKEVVLSFNDPSYEDLFVNQKVDTLRDVGGRSINNFKGDSKLFSWMYRIATNEAITQINKNAKRLQTTNESVQQSALSNLPTDVYFDGNEIQLKLQQAIATLPQKQKLVFNMKYFDDLKYKEIAEILETSEGALKASYHIAVKKLQTYLTSD